MEWLDTLGNVNFWAVLGAVLSTFVVGSVWYAEAVFGKKWMKLAKLSKKEVENKEKVIRAMVHSTVTSIVSATVLVTLMAATGTEGAANGALFGAILGFGFGMASLAMHDAFERRDTMITHINGLHDIVSTSVMGAVIGGIGVLA